MICSGIILFNILGSQCINCEIRSFSQPVQREDRGFFQTAPRNPMILQTILVAPVCQVFWIGVDWPQIGFGLVATTIASWVYRPTYLVGGLVAIFYFPINYWVAFIIPIDELIFFRGVFPLAHQPVITEWPLIVVDALVIHRRWDPNSRRAGASLFCRSRWGYGTIVNGPMGVEFG